MAVSKDDITINVSVESGSAEKKLDHLADSIRSVGNAQENASKQTSIAGDALETFGKIAAAAAQTSSAGDALATFGKIAAAAAAAYYAIIEPIKEVYSEYKKNYDAQARLSGAIRRAGEDVGSTLAMLNEYSNSLVETGKASGDTVVALITQAKSVGLATDKIEALISASLDLSAVTGKSLNEAFGSLLATYKGQARALGDQASLVLDLTDAQLRNGKAVEVIGRAYKGASDEGLATFEGQANRTKNALDELKQALGEVVAEIVNAKSPTSTLGNTLNAITKSINENKDEIVNWSKAIISAVIKVGSTMTEFALNVYKVLTYPVTKIWEFLAAWENLSNKVNKNSSSINKAISGFFGSIREKLGFATDVVSDLAETVDTKLAPGFDAIKDPINTAGAAVKRVAANFQELRDAANKSLDDLKKKLTDVAKSNALIGMGDFTQAAVKRQQDDREASDLDNKIKAGGLWNKQIASMVDKLKALNGEGFKLQTAELYRKELESMNKATESLHNEAAKYGKTQQEILAMELVAQTKLLDKERERLEAAGALAKVGPPTEAQSKILEGLEIQKKLLQDINAQKSADAPSQEYESAKMAGDDMAKSITGAFKGGAMGMIEGFGSVLDAVQGLIDFIPNMLSKIEHVLTSLTELPAKILAGVQGVFSAALKFVSDFIPNIAASAEKIINAAIDFLTKLPDVFATLLSKLPDIILGLVDRLPELVKKFANALVASGPKITMSLVKSLIKNGPHIAKNIAWMLAVELPKAIAEGIWDALKQVLSGKFNLADMFDTSSISDTFKKIGTALTGEASRLFSVTDFGTGTESIQQTALQTANAINKAFNDGVNLLMKAWKWLLDMVINPLINGLRAVWLWIYDTIIQPIFNGLKAVWSWVYDTIISPFINALTSAWNAIKSGIIDPLINGLSNAANGLRDALKPLIGAGQNIVNGIKDGLNAILSKISDAFYNIGKNLVKGLVDSLGSIGGVIGKAIGGLPSVSVSIPSFFAHGGIVGGAANVVGNSYRNDTIPAMLSPGEAVIPRSAMRDPAIAEAVKAILSGGGISRFANGMMPSLSPAASQSSIELGGITINTTQSIDADFVRLKLMPTIQKELRRASLDGQTVIYKTGVR